MKKKFIKYCNENWSLPYYEVEKALDSIGKHFGLTDAVAGHIRDLADDFECDNDLDDDWFYENFDDEEDVFWELNIFKNNN